jgi:Domain of unknown function (DUF5615)
MKPKFLLDEHLSPAIKEQLQLKDFELEVFCIGEPGVPPKATPDPAILIWTEQNNCILVTENRATMPRHLADHLMAGRKFPGMLLIKKKVSMGTLIDTLLLVAGASQAEEYYGVTKFSPLE